MSDIQLYQNFTVITCCNCGCPFAVPSHFDFSRYRDKETFFCPNGHPQSYKESEADRLKKQLDEKDRILQQSLNREAALIGSLRKTELAKRRLAKRLESGVCPVSGCKRHFTNLQRHIQTEHAGAALPPGEETKLLQ